VRAREAAGRGHARALAPAAARARAAAPRPQPRARRRLFNGQPAGRGQLPRAHHRGGLRLHLADGLGARARRAGAGWRRPGPGAGARAARAASGASRRAAPRQPRARRGRRARGRRAGTRPGVASGRAGAPGSLASGGQCTACRAAACPQPLRVDPGAWVAGDTGPPAPARGLAERTPESPSRQPQLA
jgi:hypothetical protein